MENLGVGREPDISPLTNLCLNAQGRGPRLGESRGPAVLGWSGVSAPGHRHLGAGRPFPSGSGKTKHPVSGTMGKVHHPPGGDAGEILLAVTTLLGLLTLGRLCL